MKFGDEYQIRKNKLLSAQKNGLNLYPARCRRTHHIRQVLVEFNDLLAQKAEISLAGRIKAIRLHGGSCFAHLEDGSDKMQIYFKKDAVGAKEYENLVNFLDIGDFVSATGELFTTKKGEKTLLVKKYSIIAKALLPLPEKWHGLSDVEIRYRQRYLDLIANPEVKQIFERRHIIIKTIRKFLDEAGFMEVETPILQPIPGGANARPFVTHHNALNTDFYLRIAPELYLKRLVVGGLEKVYEISRCFRNEGIDRDHNPEFTQVEFYAAYWDYGKMMKFTESLLQAIVQAVYQTNTIKHEGKKIDFTPPFKKITFQAAAKEFAGIELAPPYPDSLKSELKKIGLEQKKGETWPHLLDGLFKQFIRPKIVEPTFITDYPIELSPLAKKIENNPCFVERFQLVIDGLELCNAFSELNDPLDQEQRFQGQEKYRQAGDDEAQRIDQDFLEALAYGLPPTAGIGIGIDRLAALLNDIHNIKEIILFPTLKPKKT